MGIALQDVCFRPQNECIRDDTGYDLVDLAAAHIRAQDLARGVMRASCLADREPDWRGCTVTVTNDSQVPTLTLMFSSLVGTDLTYSAAD
jgi:hypothetical protein